MQEDFAKKKKRPWWKVLTKYMFSHIGLTITVLLYCVLGAFLFIAIEEPAEMERKRLMELEDSRLQKEIDNGLRGHWLNYKQDKYNKSMFVANATDHLKKLLPQFVEAAKTYEKYDGSSAYIVDWELVKSFLFAVSIVTTIGYGHITPETSAGQLLSIVYALIGIPLMLMCLANLGDLMANGIRYLYARVCCRCCFNKQQGHNRVGDINQQPRAGTPAGSRPGSAWSNQGSETQMVEDSGGGGEEMSLSNVTVPISLTFLICSIYIVLGAVLFSLWEGWSFIASTYFSFITVTTIGFGDLVPGMEPDEQDAHVKIGIASLYMLLGVAMVAMAIALVQEEMVAKFRWVGMKLGIVKPEEEENGEDLGEDDDDDDYESSDDDKPGGGAAAGAGEPGGKARPYQPPAAPDNLPKKKRRKKKRNKDKGESSNEDDSFEDSDLDDFNFKHDADDDVANKKKRILAA